MFDSPLYDKVRRKALLQCTTAFMTYSDSFLAPIMMYYYEARPWPWLGKEVLCFERYFRTEGHNTRTFRPVRCSSSLITDHSPTLHSPLYLLHPITSLLLSALP